MSETTNEVKTMLTMDDLAGRLGNPHTILTHDGKRITLVPPNYQMNVQKVTQARICADGMDSFLRAIHLQTTSRLRIRETGGFTGIETPHIEVNKQEMSFRFYPDTTESEDTVSMKLHNGTQLMRWISGGFTQESLVEHIETWGGDLSLSEEQRLALVMAIKNMELTSAIKFTAKRSHGNVELSFTSKDGGDSFAALPEIWKLLVPVVEGVENWPVELKLQVTVPRQEGQVPSFRFACPKLELYKEQVMEVVTNRLISSVDYPVISV